MTIDGHAADGRCGIAIVGMACRYPDAASPKQLWEMVLAGRQAFRRMPAARLRLEDYTVTRAGEADSIYPIQVAVLENYAFDRGRFRVPADTFAATDLSHWLALEVAADALADAGFADGEGLPRANTGVLVANTLTGEFSRAASLRLRWPYVRRLLDHAFAASGLDAEVQRNLLRSLEEAYKAPFAAPNADTLAGGLANVIAGRICNHFNFGGGGYTVDGACASSLLAVTTACSRLMLGEIDIALAGAVDLSLDPFELVGFARNGALARSEMRPYDARAAGFWPGEGAGFLVLMREADAAARQRPIHAVIRGYGVSSDGEGGLTRPARDGQMLALSRAYNMAGFGADQMAYFEGHGTGTAVGDPVEIEAIAETRRRHGADTSAALGSIKANIGHTKAAAGMAGMIKATMALRHQVVPPATALGEPHPVFAACAGLIEPARAMVWPKGHPLRAGVSAMGFGGINVHLVLDGGAGARRDSFSQFERRLLASGQDVELFLFAGDRRGLIAEIGRLRTVAADLSRAELGDAAAACTRRLDPAPLRAAVVAGSASELADHLKTLDGWLEVGILDRLDISGGMFIGAANQPPRVGFLFPGQAAPTHLAGGQWRRRFAEVAELYVGSGLPEIGDGTDTLVAQPAIVTASLAGLAVLDRLNLTAEVAIGHSLGELVALHWAGACDRDALQRIVAGRAQAMSAHAEAGGRMIVVAAEAACAAVLAEGLSASIACYNGPAECVLGGSAAAIERVLARAAERGIAASPLRVSHAFHTPDMAAAVPVFGEVLARERLSRPTRRFYSTITGGALSPEADPAPLLCEQLVAPVQFAPVMVELAAASDLIIEVGPGQGLTRMAQAAASIPVIALDAGGPSLRGLLTAVAAAFVLGAPVVPERIFEDRFARPFDLDRPPSFLANPCEQTSPVTTVLKEEEAAGGSGAVAGEVSPISTGLVPLDAFRHLIAQRTGFPVDSIEPSARLLSDLHLNSINVAELVTRFADEIGAPPPSTPTTYANATVAEVVEALTELRETGGARTTTDQDPPGVDSWVWPFVSATVLRELPATAARRLVAWRVMAPDEYPLREEVVRAFAAVPPAAEATGLVLCLPPNPGVEHLPLLLKGARELADRQEITCLVLLQHGGGGAGFARSLFHEHDGLQVSVIDLPVAAAAVRWAVDEAERAGPGYTEACYDAFGSRRIAVLCPVVEVPGDRPLPLRPEDVVVVSGGGKGIGAECALALAKQSGARLGLIGRSLPDDTALAASLARVAKAGVAFCYEQADVTNAEEVRRAVERIEHRLGPVTALIHSAGINQPQLASGLDLETVRATVAVKADGACNLLAAVRPASLRLFIAFGSIIARTGLRGEAHYALANEWLERLVDDFAMRHPDCQAATVHWSVWAGAGMGERLGSLEGLARQGVTPLTIEQGVAALERLLRRPLPATAIVVGSRFGAPSTVEFDCGKLPLLRFIERPRVHYPGIELVADSDISLATDPYLRDHAIGGTAVMPAVFALEAITQAVRAITGNDGLPAIENAQFLRPIVVTGEEKLTVRLAALRRSADRIELVIRSSADDFQSDHMRATARLVDRAAGHDTARLPAPASTERLPLDPGRDLYGSLLFHTGRFRRLAGYTRVAAAGAVAEIAPAGGGGWFMPFLPRELCLGDPGARDAALHGLQVCVPHRRVVPIAVERLAPGRLDPAAAYRVVARERAAAEDDFTFDVEVLDLAGQLVEQWVGLTLRAIEPLDPPAQWPLPLLGAYLERRLGARFPTEKLRVRLDFAVREDAAASGDPHRPDGKPEAPDGAISFSYADGIRLLFRTRYGAGCDLERVVTRDMSDWRRLLGRHFGFVRRLVNETGNDFEGAATRVWTVLEALRKAGSGLNAPLVFERTAADGWLELRAGNFCALSAAFQLSGQSDPFATAFVVEAGEETPSVPRGILDERASRPDLSMSANAQGLVL